MKRGLTKFSGRHSTFLCLHALAIREHNPSVLEIFSRSAILRLRVIGVFKQINKLPNASESSDVHGDCISLEDTLQVTIGDATKTLASRIWDTWIPFGSESETEVTTVASCRIPLADILAAGKLVQLPNCLSVEIAVL